jgi:hypothetical protein
LQRRVCGAHTPVQALPLQRKGQVDVSCQLPFSSHVCKIVAVLHRALPGAHTPAHPMAAHTNVHGVALLHAPLGPQVEKKLPSHFVIPGWQIPTHTPAMQRKGQVTSVCHDPARSHESRSRPMHFFDPDAQPTSTIARSSLASMGGPASGNDPGSGPLSASRSTGPASPFDRRKSPSTCVHPARRLAVDTRKRSDGREYFMTATAKSH